LNNANFFRGLGVARGVPQNSLDNFNISLYCLGVDELTIDIDDPNRSPDDDLVGDLSFLADGIVRRTGRGVTYQKTSSKATNGIGAPRKDIAMRMIGMDIEDGSMQYIDLLCIKGLCDITLQDVSFSTCINFTTADIYLGGLAIARNIPQESLNNFKLDLYCVTDPRQIFLGINYTLPTTTLNGSMVFIDDGIVSRTAKNFTYFNLFKESKTRSNRLFTGVAIRGAEYFDGGEKTLSSYCFEDGMCEVILYELTFAKCLQTTGRPYFNGVGRVMISKSALKSIITVPVYCIPLPFNSWIDISNANATFYVNVTLNPAKPPGRYFDEVTGGSLWKTSYGF
jgi:hypothetical protein